MKEAVRKSPDKQTGEVHSNEVPSFPNVLSSHTALSYTCYGYYQHSPVLSRAVLEGFSAKEQDPVSDLLTSKERNHAGRGWVPGTEVASSIIHLGQSMGLFSVANIVF